MATSLKYTARDFDEYFEELKRKAQEVFPDWTDFNLSNIGVLFLELLSRYGDHDSYMLNAHISETYLGSVKRRRNAIKILDRMDYVLGGLTAASVDLTFSFEGGGTHTQDVIITEGYQVKDESDTYVFETTDDLTITAGNPDGTVSAKSWYTVEEDIELDGSSNQDRFLNEVNYIQVDSIYIDALLWTQVPNFLESGSDDKHFKVDIDDELKAIIVFGDGIRGLRPDGDGTVTYKVGYGSIANTIRPGKITVLTTDILDVLSDPVSMEVTNDESPSGGEDEESIDEARKKAPRSIRYTNVTVSRDDYEGNAEDVPGVARAFAASINEYSTIALGNVIMHIVPEGGGSPSVELLEAVEDYLKNGKPIMIGSFVDAQGAEYVTIDVIGTVNKRAGFLAADVKNAIDTAITGYFKYDNIDDNNRYVIDFGYYKPKFYKSSLIDIIMNTTINDVECVDSVILSSPAESIDLDLKEIPALGTLTGLVVV
jgi:uncharacterized phage protein gp47/JayE